MSDHIRTIRTWIRGESDPAAARKWSQRLASVLALLIWAVPTVVLTEKSLSGDHAILIFSVVYGVAGAAMLWLALRLWTEYDSLARLLGRKTVLVTSLFVIWGTIALYDFILLKRPVNLSLLVFTSGCLLTIVLTLALPAVDWAKFTTFVVLFFLIFAWVQVILTPRMATTDDFYRLDTNSLDVAIIGNSHAYHGFDTNIIRDVLGVESYILTYAGAGMDSMVMAAKQVLQTQTPRLLIIEAYPMRLNTTQPEQGLLKSAQIAHYGLRGALYFESIPRFFSRDEYPIALSSLLYYHSQWKGFSPYEGAKNLGYAVLDALPTALQTRLLTARGVADHDVIGQHDIPPAQFDPPYDSTGAVTDAEVDALNDVLALARARNIDVILVDAPTIWTTTMDLPEDTPTRRVAEMSGVPFVDANIGPAEFDRIHFQDFGHLNQFGSAVLTLYLTELIAECLDVSIATTHFEHYRSILIDDLVVMRQNNQMIYSLETVVEDSPGAEFAWRVVDANNTTLLMLPYSDQNTIVFPLPDEGMYTIEMSVRNRYNPALRFTGILTERFE